MGRDEPSGLRPPQQARSQATLERLLKSTEQLIAEASFDQATVSKITRRSHCSVGAFYNRFLDKEALLDCFDDRFFQRARQHWDTFFASPQWRQGQLEQRVRRLVTLLVQKNREHRRVLRSLAVYALARPDPRYTARRMQLEDYVLGQIKKGLLAGRSGITHPKPSLAVELALRMILSTVQAVILFGSHFGGKALSDDVLAGELTRAFLAYLGIADSSRRRAK
jgi:AcrR family transcriptional regulator